MAFTYDTSIGGVASNGYASIAYIDDFSVGTAYASQWQALTLAAKQAIAVRAAQAVDTLVVYAGYKQTQAQHMVWPRYDVQDASGYWYATNIIPACVLDAHAQYACWLAAQSDDPLGASDAGALRSITVEGAVTLDYRDDAVTAGVDYFERVIVPILRSGGVFGHGSGARLTR